MKTLNWRCTGWVARNFIFSGEDGNLGKLTFNSGWNFNAIYDDKETRLKFTQKSFWDGDILIVKDGKTVGEIHTGLFGEQILILATGERFTLSTSLWEQEACWKNDGGETIITYQQSAMSSLRNGSITLKDSLALETERLLISSGLFARQITRKRIARTVAIIIPIIAAASRL